MKIIIFALMFVRKKKNPSGIVSVQVIEKVKGKYKLVKTIGSSSDATTIEELHKEGKNWIEKRQGVGNIFSQNEEIQSIKNFISNIDNILLNGTQLILNQVFKLVGFDKIEDEIFKHLVIARICQPSSKAATVEYLKSYFDEDLELHKIYRYLDKLHNTQQDFVQQISVAHTRKILGGKIGLVFYDVTTLYFETDLDDDLRSKGWSKDGKHSQPQIVLGLLVSKGGYPLAYSIFNGSQYEAHTMIPVVEDFVKRFQLEDFVVVADSGLMNKTNISLLESNGYKYIIGERIKSESKEIKKRILSQQKQDGLFHETTKNTARLIIGYTDKRAKKR